MLKAYILIETFNGRTYRYVRDVVGDTTGDTSKGVNAEYYIYGDTVGDTYGFQAGDSGYIGFDFNNLATNLGSGDSYLLWPENAGDTYLLERVNQDQPLGTDYGDTLTVANPYMRIKLRTSSIQEIRVVETRISGWPSGGV